MKLVVFHYHLLPGGVTDVIRLSLQSLIKYYRELEAVLIVSGLDKNSDKVAEEVRNASGNADVPVETDVFPLIGYSEHLTSSVAAETLTSLLLEKYGGEDTVWMVHNYHLGKNPVFTDAILNCMEDGEQRVLITIHDFPECSRFQNLKKIVKLNRNIYPEGKNIRYSVINSRDRQLLLDAGMGEDSIRLLANPVPPSRLPECDSGSLHGQLEKRFSGAFPAFRKDGKILFYPVRTIRRKNVLEAGYLAALMEDPVNLVVTLPGISPLEKGYSDLVESAFRDGLIPGIWGTGLAEEDDDFNFRILQAGCDAVVSSSVQEGFGYLFINALYWRKPLISRHLDILDGIDHVFEGYPAMFYAGCPVPLSAGQKNEILNEYDIHLSTLEPVFPREAFLSLKQRFEALWRQQQVDFSFLPPRMQLDVLKNLGDPEYREDCRSLNRDTLKRQNEILNRGNMPDLALILESVFGEKVYAGTFSEIMESFGTGCEGPEISGNPVMDAMTESFAQPEYYRLLYRQLSGRP